MQIIIISIALNINVTNAKLSGQALIDSLESELKLKEIDTNYVQILNELSFKYYMTNPDKGLAYGKESVKLSNELNYQGGLARAYNALGVNYAAGKSDYETAVEMYKKSLDIYIQIDNKRGIGSAYNNIGLVYQFSGNKKEAIEYFEKSKELCVETSNRKGEAGALNDIGNIFNDWGDYPTALDYFQKSLNIYKKIEDKPGISFYLNNIGLIHNDMNELEKAQEYFEKILLIQEEIEDMRGVANTKNNLATISTKKGNYLKAIDLLNDSFNYFLSVNNYESLSNIYTNYGIAYKNMGEFNKVLENFEKSYQIRKEQSSKVREANSIANIGSVFYAKATQYELDELKNKNLNTQNDLDKAIEYFEEAITIFKSEGELSNRSEFSKDLSMAYELIGNSKQALRYYKEYHTLNDSIFNKEKTKELTNLLRKQELKEKQLKEQEIKNKIELERAFKFRLQYLGIASIVIDMGLILYLLGKFSIKEWLARAMAFLTIILIFEFLLVIIDPITDDYSSGEPIIKFSINLITALIIFPMHQYLERKVSNKILRN